MQVFGNGKYKYIMFKCFDRRVGAPALYPYEIKYYEEKPGILTLLCENGIIFKVDTINGDLIFCNDYTFTQKISIKEIYIYCEDNCILPMFIHNLVNTSFANFLVRCKIKKIKDSFILHINDFAFTTNSIVMKSCENMTVVINHNICNIEEIYLTNYRQEFIYTIEDIEFM